MTFLERVSGAFCQRDGDVARELHRLGEFLGLADKRSQRLADTPQMHFPRIAFLLQSIPLGSTDTLISDVRDDAQSWESRHSFDDMGDRMAPRRVEHGPLVVLEREMLECPGNSFKDFCSGIEIQLQLLETRTTPDGGDVLHKTLGIIATETEGA